MSDSSLQPALERNVCLYPWYAFAYNARAWLPVFVLYFMQYMPLDQVLRLEAIYYAAVFVLEVPSGYFSDRVGRRPTLLISGVAMVLAYVLFLVGGSVGASGVFAVFAAGQVLLAAGISFNSGTDTSFHYDSLAMLGRSAEFDAREAIVSRNGFRATAVAALAGGLLGVFDLRLAYVLSLIAAVASIVIVWRCREPSEHKRDAALGIGFAAQLRKCFGLLRVPKLAWLFGFALLMIILNHIPYEFYQPYIRLLGERAEMPVSEPPIAGFHTFLTMIIGSWLAACSIRLRDRIGEGPALLLATIMQVVIILIMGMWLNHIILWLVVLRSAPRALMTAPLNAAIAPLVEQGQRATYFSIQSLAGRLSFALALLGLSFAGTSADRMHLADSATWPEMSRMLMTAAAIGAGGFMLLLATVHCLRRDGRQ